MDIKEKIIINQAEKKNINDIRRLINYLMVVEKTKSPKKQTDIVIKERVLPTFKKSSLSKVFLANLDKKVVGLIITEIKHGLTLSVAYIVIGENYQGLGIGNALVDYVQKYAKKIKMKKLSVLVSIDNKKAQQFYKKQKFYPSCYFLQKDI